MVPRVGAGRAPAPLQEKAAALRQVQPAGLVGRPSPCDCFKSRGAVSRRAGMLTLRAHLAHETMGWNTREQNIGCDNGGLGRGGFVTAGRAMAACSTAGRISAGPAPETARDAIMHGFTPKDAAGAWPSFASCRFDSLANSTIAESNCLKLGRLMRPDPAGPQTRALGRLGRHRTNRQMTRIDRQHKSFRLAYK